MSNVMTLYAHHTDKELVDKVKAGQATCFEVLVRRHTQGLYRIARGYDLSHTKARDMLRNTHIEAYATLERSAEELSYCTWLTKRMIFNCGQTEEGWVEDDGSEYDCTEPSCIAGRSAFHFDSDRFVVSRELPCRLDSGMERLSSPLRLVYILSEIEGFSPLEIKGILGLTDDQLQFRLQKAKASLRKSLRRWYQNTDIYYLRADYFESIIREVLDGIGGKVLPLAGVPRY